MKVDAKSGSNPRSEIRKEIRTCSFLEGVGKAGVPGGPRHFLVTLKNPC
jgi:hypothetical protein